MKQKVSMPPQLSRRAFLRAALAGAVPLGLAGCAWPGVAGALAAPTPPPLNEATAAIIGQLRAQFGYLQLDEAGLLAFARDFQAKAGKKVLAQRTSDPGQFEYTLGTQFLLSSDFFTNGADEARPVRYVAYHDLYNGCASPFARFDFS